MKLIYYPPAFFLSQLYAYSLKRKYARTMGLVDKNRFSVLMKTVKNQMLSPIRNGAVDLAKNLIAAYFINPGDTVIDAGAHVGSYTMLYSSLVGATGRVHAYEAHPDIFQKLDDRFKNLQQVSTHNYAVSNQSEIKIKMKIYPDEIQHECATVEASLMNAERMPGNTALILVPCQKLDVHLIEIAAGKCSFIKIDVEGHEHAVIDGAKELIQKHRPIIIYEYGYERGKFEARTIEQLNSFGYVSFDCNTLVPVYPRYIPLNSVTDLVAIPKERVPSFEALIPLLKSNSRPVQ